jgi:exopolysaccharide biosynthesis protein
MASLTVLSASPAAFSQEVPETPMRTAELAAAIAGARFEEMEPGLSVLSARSRLGTALVAFRIDQQRFRFAVAVQDDPDGERVDVFAQRSGAVLAVNGGFFGEKEFRKNLYPVGLLRIDGKDLSANWKTTGGYLLLHPDRLEIAPSVAKAPARPAMILQSKPLIIEPGGRWSMNTNQEIVRPRTILCTLASGEVLLFVFSGSGLSLYEAGWLLRSKDDDGVFGCDAALAMDGGGSTQLHVPDRPGLSVFGETAVQNALLLLRR